MASGDTHWFVDYLVRVFNFKEGDYGATPNSIKCALIKSAANGGIDPAINTPYPTWGAGGSTDLSAAEVSAGGTYSSGGQVVSTPVASSSGNTLLVDWGNPASWGQDGANPTNARWAIFYDLTTTNNDCICYIDLGSDRDLSSGELTIAMGSPAALQIACS